jgi:hypothetical protein
MHTDDTDLKESEYAQGRLREHAGDFFNHGKGVRLFARRRDFQNFDFKFEGNFRSADCSVTLELCYTA